MKIMRSLMALLCVLMLALPAAATEPAATQSATLPPLVVGVRTLSEIPENWNPLSELTDESNAILQLTSQRLYEVSDGAAVPAMAAALPVDVTAEFAGRYHIPEQASRGYAFAITLRSGTFWSDGKALTVADWCYTLEKLLEQDRFPLEIANYQAYRWGETAPAQQIVSLMDAGYDSVAEAREAGIFDFYIDTTYFWGLDTGWRRVTDRTRLYDSAIPSGCGEMYVTPAYLYREYLGENGSQTMFQSEFVGIPAESGEKMTMNDVGLFTDGDRLILVVQEQTTASHLALVLSEFYPVPQGTAAANYGTAANYQSCGPYRVVSATTEEILLEPNPCWTQDGDRFELVRCRVSS